MFIIKKRKDFFCQQPGMKNGVIVAKSRSIYNVLQQTRVKYVACSRIGKVFDFVDLFSL